MCPSCFSRWLKTCILCDRIAERHPALKPTIDHFGLTGGKDEAAFRNFDKLLTLAGVPTSQ